MALKTIHRWISEKDSNYVTVTGVHGVMESQHHDDIRRIHNQAGLVTPDGMPMVWLGRRRGYEFVDRVYGPDLMLAVCQDRLFTGARHFLYGGGTGVPEMLRDKLMETFPGLQVVGTHSPPFRTLSSKERTLEIDMINETDADIVWVGLSTPKQERWMAASVDHINGAVLIGVGAAFDFHAGLKKQAPAWMQRSGLEWFFRMVSEPRRLWRRYLGNNTSFLFNIALQESGLKQFTDDWSKARPVTTHDSLLQSDDDESSSDS